MTVIRALASCHFVVRAGGFVQTFLVLYLTQDRHLSAGTAGSVATAVGIGAVVSLLAGGWLGDRIGRRRTMLIGFSGTALALLALASADTLPAIWVAALLVGLLSELFRPAGSATVADLPGERERIRSFGLLFWASNLGFSVCTATGGLLVQYGYGLLFWLNAAAAVIAALIVWRRMPETRPSAPTGRARLLPAVLGDRRLLALALVFAAHFALFAQAFSSLPLVMAAGGLGTSTFGMVLGLNGVVILVAQPFAVRVLAGLDRYAVLSVSALLVGIGFGLGVFVDSGLGYGLAALVWTAGEIGIAVMFAATFTDLAPAGMRGGYLGVAYAAWGVGTALGPVLGTALLERAGPTVLWLACALMGLVSSAILRACRSLVLAGDSGGERGA
ncbi:MFS transporter [Tenggerimyces flavus]|uniref:MFS transporter n=1 Tax=Tenggerimyces flavus TaxID=1708749 RepID=A0ABV7Y6N0_9ACTN|nr:MFS transporter [Tenggerimyces flavus]MBM7791143.1 MFS family permease [Tenggerimyces flavus]